MGASGSFSTKPYFVSPAAGSKRMYVQDANGCRDYVDVTVSKPAGSPGEDITDERAADTTIKNEVARFAPNPSPDAFQLICKPTESFRLGEVYDAKANFLFMFEGDGFRLSNYPPGNYIVRLYFWDAPEEQHLIVKI
jgi:hypothetical protein